MKRYTLGFIFDSSLEYVLLMHKNRPTWQGENTSCIQYSIFSGNTKY